MKNLKYSCDKCDKSFNSKHGVLIHIARMHTFKGKRWARKTAKANKNRNKAEINSQEEINSVFMTNVSKPLAYCPCCGTDLRKVAVALTM